MKNQRIAVRYAKALFMLSKEFNMTDKVKADMALIEEVIKNSPDFKAFLASPIIREEKKLKVIEEIFAQKINEITHKFINLIVGKRRFMYIDAIAVEYLNFFRAFKGIKKAQIQSVVPLNDENKQSILEILKAFTHTEIELIEELRKELIGGFVLKIDDKQYDASIKSKITKLTKEYSINVYEKGL